MVDQASRVLAGPPVVPVEFWSSPPLRAALAERHIGRVIRAYRTHPWHGSRPLPQEVVAEWLGTTQPRLSRIENGPRTEQLDLLVHWSRVLRVPQRFLWFALPHRTAAEFIGQDLGVASRQRSAALAAPVIAGSRLAYVPNSRAIAALRRFVTTPSRVFLLSGPPGVGKTSLGLRLIEHLNDVADVQIHQVGPWADDDAGLAAEILRYASATSAADPLAELERSAARLVRPCLVVIDGVATQADMDTVAGAVDRVLRQVLSAGLRFVVIARTPPELDVTRAPLFAATLDGDRLCPGPSYRMEPWSDAEAAQAWDGAVNVAGSFSQLPPGLRQLGRSPLHLRLLAEADDTADTARGSYDLIGAFVRRALRGTGAGTTATLLAIAAAQRPEVAALLTDLGASPLTAGADDELPALHAPHDSRLFVHDVLAEYLLAEDLVARLCVRGLSATAPRTLDRLALLASTSAAARGVLELAVEGLDRTAPSILTHATPNTNQRNALPLLLGLGVRKDLTFLDADLIAACARRCREVETARALLAVPGLENALGLGCGRWLVDILRTFGSALWPDVIRAVEAAPDTSVAQALLDASDLDDPSDAVFVARHFPAFLSASSTSEPLAPLLENPDWRVRAALAEGLEQSGSEVAAYLVEELLRDPDYKVRAAVALGAGTTLSRERSDLFRRLLHDDNWHVRGHALARTGQGAEVAETLRRALADDPSWQAPPVHVAAGLARCALRAGAWDIAETVPREALDRALFEMLRECRTGWSVLADSDRVAVLERAHRSRAWPVCREASDHTRPPAVTHEAFRRLRGGRSVQVALDLHDLDHAVELAAVAAEAGVDLLEVGDLLVKQAGLVAITAVKKAAPTVTVVAEMMSADWGRDQVELAARAGADVVLLIGLASTTSIAAAVGAGRRLGVPIMLDAPPGPLDRGWVREAERLGVDAFVVTTNIDHGVRGRRPLDRARTMRCWTELPLAVSGGFGPTNHDVLNDPDWDVLIVGRSIVEAVDPAAAMAAMLTKVRARSARA